MTKPSMIAIDWGSTSARAYLLDAQGRAYKTHSEPLGVKNVPENGFDSALRRLCGAWLEAHPDVPVFSSGMVGSNRGWRDAPYVGCPAGIASLSHGMVTVEMSGGRLMYIVPGVRYTAQNGLHDVMRGEETQVFGALPADSADRQLLLLPGTHSKWVLIENREIVWFTTFMTGELFDMLRAYSLLSQRMSGDAARTPADTIGQQAFHDGIEGAMNAHAEGAGVLSRLFTVRTRGLIDGLTGTESKQYLSGLLIGGEVAEGVNILKQQGIGLRHVTLVGDVELCELYREAVMCYGFTSEIYRSPAAADGLWAIANDVAALERPVHA